VSDDTSAENVGMTEQAPPPPATLVATPNP